MEKIHRLLSLPNPNLYFNFHQPTFETSPGSHKTKNTYTKEKKRKHNILIANSSKHFLSFIVIHTNNLSSLPSSLFNLRSFSDSLHILGLPPEVSNSNPLFLRWLSLNRFSYHPTKLPTPCGPIQSILPPTTTGHRLFIRWPFTHPHIIYVY